MRPHPASCFFPLGLCAARHPSHHSTPPHVVLCLPLPGCYGSAPQPYLDKVRGHIGAAIGVEVADGRAEAGHRHARSDGLNRHSRPISMPAVIPSCLTGGQHRQLYSTGKLKGSHAGLPKAAYPFCICMSRENQESLASIQNTTPSACSFQAHCITQHALKASPTTTKHAF